MMVTIVWARDQITIETWGYPELSPSHTIGPDGRITLPLKPFKAVNLSREQAAQQIKDKLIPYYQTLNTTVRVDKYAANRILVLGRVIKPGEVQFGTTAPTLLESIALAGGLSNNRKTTDSGDTLPFTRCAVFRGRDKVAWIGLEPLLTGKDLRLNIKLQRNDIVYVPDLEERLIYVLGAVSHPKAFPLTPNMSFLEALSKAWRPLKMLLLVKLM
ncbi:MAG: polysaccharide biosynthesis/export family protein [Thiotrichaceae bacterium]